MSIQLKGNDDSSFSDDVVIGGSVDVSGQLTASFNQPSGFVSSIVNTSTTGGDGLYLNVKDTSSAIVVQRQSDNQNSVLISGDGSAEFAGTIKLGGPNQISGDNGIELNALGYASYVVNGGTNIDFPVLAIYKGTTQTVRLEAGGSATFTGTVTAPNTFLALDTGGTLDVKERLQNTQAILYRLKAALIQPDADANQLRTRLLEALDILTSDGDES